MVAVGAARHTLRIAAAFALFVALALPTRAAEAQIDPGMYTAGPVGVVSGEHARLSATHVRAVPLGDRPALGAP